MTLKFEALIEQWREERLLFVRELPGFVVIGSSTRDLAEKTPTALRKHMEWLIERELIEPPEGEIDLHVAEELSNNEGVHGPRFEADLSRPDEDEIETALSVGRVALTDLIDAFESLPETFDAALADETLRHVATLDLWYASRLGVVTLDRSQPDPVDDLIAAAGTFEDAVDSIAQRDEPDLVLLDGEEWTLAKVLRRRTGHLREHLSNFQPTEQLE